MLIENCYIAGMSLVAPLFVPDIRVWWEVGPCKHVEIRNNVIYIHDNCFIDIPQSAIYVSSAKQVRNEGNRFRNC
ncbi:MAG: hypothetical protein IKD37_04560 [Clostridia bacterium]|nr:hypothetical protein [Clostridia bacterium]